MASRSTLKKAQELKAKFEANHPNAEIRIIDRSGIARIGRGVAESNGFEIVEDDGGIMVTINEVRFEVLEVRHCKCGAEILTAAIGEWGLDECQACKETRETRQRIELDESIERSHQAVAEMTWRGEWEER